MNRIANTMSVAETTVPEVKNSRTEIEIAHLVGKNADRRRTLFHLQGDHMFEDVGGQHDIDLLAGHVDDAATHDLEQKIESDRRPSPTPRATSEGIAPFGIARS